MTLNILNPKALERQLKVVEAKIAELQAEMEGLEKIRNACLVLMGTVEMPAATAPNETKVAEPKVEIQDKIKEILQDREQGLTAEQIYEHLKSQGVPVPKKVNAVFATLKKSPDLFAEMENGNWREVKSEAAVPTESMVN